MVVLHSVIVCIPLAPISKRSRLLNTTACRYLSSAAGHCSLSCLIPYTSSVLFLCMEELVYNVLTLLKNAVYFGLKCEQCCFNGKQIQ